MLETKVISTKGTRQWQGIPTIERAPNGRLWCAFFTGGPREPDIDNYVLITTSDDDGQTWTQPRTAVEWSGATRVFDPCLWHDPEGKFWLFFNVANLGEKHHSVAAITTTESSSDSPRWSEPFMVDLSVPYAFRLNKPTVTKSGKWLLPVTWAREAPDGWFAGSTQLQGVAISSDKGRNWQLHGALVAPEWALENMVVERSDGTLWMLIRNGSGVIMESVSMDGGISWSEPAKTALVNPGTRFYIRRLNSGRLLLINTPNPEERTSLFACLSRDDGVTFGKGLNLDGRENVSYPDAVQAPDGKIYTVHDCDRHGPGEIVFCTFTESDLVDAI